MHPLALFAIAASIWGTTWYAITFQLEALAPELAVTLRFAFAGGVILAFCWLRGIPLRFTRRQHAAIALLGLTTYSVGYILIYHAEQHIVSGLVAIGYAAGPLINLLLARMLLGTRLSKRVALGGVLGVTGIAMIFWPELTTLQGNPWILIGAAQTMIAVLISCYGNVWVGKLYAEGVSGWAPLALSMLWGSAISLVCALLSGVSFSIQWSPAFALSFLYLALFGSVITFGAYFALIGRIGAARAAYVGVMSPVIALLVSAAYEGFDWRAATVAGVALAVAGNVLALWNPRPRPTLTSPLESRA
ncbi:MAG: EamA family transporter [Burkholderiaceae bacterium]